MARRLMSSILRASSIADLPSPVAICCHDAGGANLIAAWIEGEPKVRVLVCAEGPASTILSAVTDTRTFRPLENLLDGAASLISGSGWASSLEHDARAAARSRGIPVLAVLDHWVNYRMRFSRCDREVLPDALVVTDSTAEALAAQVFGGDIPILVWENLYLKKEAANVRQYSRQAVAVPATRVLVLLEPIREDWNRGDVERAEFRALNFLANNISVISPAQLTVRLRPHPSEPTSKYLPWVLRQRDLRIEMSNRSSLAQDLAWADVAAGLESYALVVALEAGRRAICYLPPKSKECSLRHSGLEYLRDLVGKPS